MLFCIDFSYCKNFFVNLVIKLVVVGLRDYTNEVLHIRNNKGDPSQYLLCQLSHNLYLSKPK